MKKHAVKTMYFLAVLVLLAYAGYALYAPPTITPLELLDRQLADRYNIDF